MSDPISRLQFSRDGIDRVFGDGYAAAHLAADDRLVRAHEPDGAVLNESPGRNRVTLASSVGSLPNRPCPLTRLCCCVRISSSPASHRPPISLRAPRPLSRMSPKRWVQSCPLRVSRRTASRVSTGQHAQAVSPQMILKIRMRGGQARPRHFHHPAVDLDPVAVRV
jgi:hypothetical protein